MTKKYTAEELDEMSMDQIRELVRTHFPPVIGIDYEKQPRSLCVQALLTNDINAFYEGRPGGTLKPFCDIKK